MTSSLKQFKLEAEHELAAILDFWMKYTPDPVNGGFYGRVTIDNKPDPGAYKGSVLNSRILWTFSSAYQLMPRKAYFETAKLAYNYLLHQFVDREFGGVYWTVDPTGIPADTRKQVYALAFALYAFTEYYKIDRSDHCLQTCIQLFTDIEQNSFDEKAGGYLEAFTRDWKPVADLRLSSKDANEKKTMNTHLHILEAYTNLYKVWPEAKLKEQLQKLIMNFIDHIIDKKSSHLQLFFDEEWRVKSDTISYGHDIEAAWLLQEATDAVGDQLLKEKVNMISTKIAIAAAEGLDSDGGLWYEYQPSDGGLIAEKHWWPQAEAMVGFLNTWQQTKNNLFLEYSLNTWRFIKAHILAPNGEWRWGINADYSVMENQDKAGLWKCPYHNGRACMELMRRIDG